MDEVRGVPAQVSTALGADVIRECNRLGILVDLAHGSVDMVRAALKITKTPVIISHTGLDTQLGQNPNMARMMRPRLISKELARDVAGAGGVVSVWTHLADTPAEYAQNIRALVDVMGIDHVGIGTDTKLTPSSGGSRGGGRGPQGNPDVRQDANAGGRSEGGVEGGRGPGGQGGGRVGERTNQVWQGQDAGFYYTVVDAMLKAGFTPGEIGKVGGGNFLRVFDAATASKP